MNRKEITSGLSEMLEKYICPNDDPRIYYAREVSFNYGGGITGIYREEGFYKFRHQKSSDDVAITAYLKLH